MTDQTVAILRTLAIAAILRENTAPVRYVAPAGLAPGTYRARLTCELAEDGALVVRVDVEQPDT